MAAAPELPARFTPLQRASVARRTLVVVFGPLLWLVALVVVGVVLERRRAVEIALIVTLIALLLSIPLSVLGRRGRIARETKQT